jgi:pilus assembly protein CpaE
VELVGTAADPAKAGTKLAESGAQVILHGTTSTDHVPTAEIEAIRGVTAAPIVLVTSASANALLSEALSAGIFDVVLLPQLTDGIVFTIKKANSLAVGRATGSGGAKATAALEGRVVTFFSPKGGAGKTVLACNLAATVARQQQRKTLLLDLDLQFGDAAIMMGIEPEKTIYDLVMARRELDTDALAGYVTAHSSGVHVLPAPLRPEDAELVTEERLGHLFAVAKESYDVIVVDTPLEVAVERLQRDRGMAEADARARMARQASREERLAKADRVVDNSGDPAELHRQLDELWTWLQDLPPAVHPPAPS